MILSLVFISGKKTNFLVRVFAYFTVPVTLLPTVLWLNNFPAFKPSQSLVGYCYSVLQLYLPGLTVSLWVIAVLSFTINITLLQKLCSANCDCCLRQPRRNRFPRLRVCLELLFVMLAIMLPLLLFLTVCTVSIVGEETTIHSIFLRLDKYIKFVVSILSVPLALSFISYMILGVWFCKARRQIASGTMLKQIALFCTHILVTVVATLLFGFLFMEWFDVDGSGIGLMLVLTLLTLFPLCVFVYMRYTFIQRDVRYVGNLNRRDLHTAGLQTDPDSTRVSLPIVTWLHMLQS